MSPADLDPRALTSQEESAEEAEVRIRSVIDAWAIWRDSGVWDALRATWTADGRMHTTWFRGSADDFVARARAASEAGSSAHHCLGGSAVEVAGRRAVAQTRVTISQRLWLGGTEVDVTCVARFFDFFERRDRAWQIVLREPVYDKDRIDPVVPGQVPVLDQEVLASLPPGCRHLLYCQIASGMQVHTDTVGSHGDDLTRLHLDGQDWLTGEALRR